MSQFVGDSTKKTMEVVPSVGTLLVDEYYQLVKGRIDFGKEAIETKFSFRLYHVC